MEYKRKNRIRMILFFAGMLAIFLISLRFTVYRKNMTNKKYSVVLYQNTENDWASLLNGVKQAAADIQAEVNYVTLLQNATAKDAIEMMEREYSNGTEGILIAAVDSEALKEPIEQMRQKIPVVTVETGIGEEDADITADNYVMGYEIGEQIIADLEEQGRLSEEKTCQVAIICEFMERSSVRMRYQGLVDCLKAEAKIQILEWSRSQGDYSLPLLIEKMLNQNGEDTVVAALDKYATESLIDAIERKGKQIKDCQCYGFGSTEKIVNGLDEGRLTALMYQNEFNMGYLGLNKLMGKKGLNQQNMAKAIAHKIVARDVLYEEENQRLLFPIN